MMQQHHILHKPDFKIFHTNQGMYWTPGIYLSLDFDLICKPGTPWADTKFVSNPGKGVAILSWSHSSIKAQSGNRPENSLSRFFGRPYSFSGGFLLTFFP